MMRPHVKKRGLSWAVLWTLQSKYRTTLGTERGRSAAGQGSGFQLRHGDDPKRVQEPVSDHDRQAPAFTERLL